MTICPGGRCCLASLEGILEVVHQLQLESERQDMGMAVK